LKADVIGRPGEHNREANDFKLHTNKNMTDQSRTLEELEDENWGEQGYDSYLVQTIHKLRRKPIGAFTIEDLRIMLSQKVGMEHFTPLALDRLETDPFVSGDFYPGDLLGAVMAISREYWLTHPAEAARMRTVADYAEELLNNHDEVDEIKTRLRSLISARPWHAA
jgi:CDI immunity proteins